MSRYLNKIMSSAAPVLPPYLSSSLMVLYERLFKRASWSRRARRRMSREERPPRRRRDLHEPFWLASGMSPVIAQQPGRAGSCRRDQSAAASDVECMSQE